MDKTPPAKPIAKLTGYNFFPWSIWAVVSLLCIFGAVWRIYVYAPLDPMTDQVFFIQWIKKLRLADHIFPLMDDDIGFLPALMLDEESLVNMYLRQIYAAHQHIFTSFSLLWLYIWSFAAGFEIDGQVKISICTASAAALALSLSSLFCFHTSIGKYRHITQALCGLIFIVFAFANGFLADFSATGPHNVGALMLFLGLGTTTLWMRRGGGKAGLAATLGMLFVQVIAFYTYYTNIFLLAPATFLAVAVYPNWSWQRRMRSAAWYAGAVTLIMMPAFSLAITDILGVIGASSPATFFDVGREAVVFDEGLLGPLLDRLIRCYLFHSAQTGVAMMVLGVVGLVALWRYEGLPLPSMIMIAYISASATMQGFGYFQKTSGYIIPLLLFGAAYIVTRAAFTSFEQSLSGNWLISVIAAFPIMISAEFIFTEIRAFGSYPRSNEMIGFVNRSHASRAVFKEIDSRIAPGDVVIPGLDTIGQVFTAYSQKSAQDVRVFRPLDTMIDKMQSGQLQNYLELRGLELPGNHNVVLLASPDNFKGLQATKVREVLNSAALGLIRPVRINHIHTWLTSDHHGLSTSLSLYKLE